MAAVHIRVYNVTVIVRMAEYKFNSRVELLLLFIEVWRLVGNCLAARGSSKRKLETLLALACVA